MKSWNECYEGMTIYIKNQIEILDDNDICKETKEYQKAYVEYYYDDEICLIISGGEFNGRDLYFHDNEDTPDMLLTEDEYKLLNINEHVLWNELQKFIPNIDVIKEKSNDIVKLRELIIKNKNIRE